jgi:hypothetical protein
LATGVGEVAAQQPGARQRLGRVVAEAHDLVVLVHEDDPRLVGARLGVVHQPVGDEDDQVAGVHQTRCGAVDPDDAGARARRG